MLKRLLVFLTLLLLAVPVFAQEETPEAEAETASTIEPWVCPEGFEGQELHLFNWTLYIADNTVPDFEEACGVTVVSDYYYSNEELLAILRQGNPGYDVIVPTGYMVEILIKEELLQPINLDNIPNFANVSEGLANPPYDPENQYSVPYQWGTVGIAYNKTMVEEPPTSWYDLFEYEGDVAWLEDPRAMIGVGLLLNGYDANSDDPAQIEEARDFMIENGGNVSTIIIGNSQDLLARGEVAMAVDYPGNTFQLLATCECDDYAYVVPEEGANVWVDNLAIATDAPNPELAEVFLDYILHPQVSADISNYTVYGTPNQVAQDEGLIAEEILTNPAIYPPQEVREKLFFVESVPGEAEQAYNDAWDEIKIAIGS
jgi:spermidine/putrescine transport system substrate-binding protein